MADKKVDESWKDSVTKEKKVPDSSQKITREDEPVPQGAPDAGFPFFISTLGMQALSALGALPDPVTGKEKTTLTSSDLGHAKYLIDIIQMLSEKTKGNLSEEESSMLQNLLYELRLKFVEKNGL